MNWTVLTTIALGLLAFPLSVIGIVALAGGVLIAGRLSRKEDDRKRMKAF